MSVKAPAKAPERRASVNDVSAIVWESLATGCAAGEAAAEKSEKSSVKRRPQLEADFLGASCKLHPHTRWGRTKVALQFCAAAFLLEIFAIPPVYRE
jgi:hypothetical protein